MLSALLNLPSLVMEQRRDRRGAAGPHARHERPESESTAVTPSESTAECRDSTAGLYDYSSSLPATRSYSTGEFRLQADSTAGYHTWSVSTCNVCPKSGSTTSSRLHHSGLYPSFHRVHCALTNDRRQLEQCWIVKTSSAGGQRHGRDEVGRPLRTSACRPAAVIRTDDGQRMDGR